MYDKKIEFVNNWKMVYCENHFFKKYKNDTYNIKSLEGCGFKKIESPSVPGTFHAEYCQKVLKIDPYYADNPIKLQKLENIHVWYYNTFDIPEEFSHPYILFECIDTVADIYFNGKLITNVDNMFIPHKVYLKNFMAQDNEIIVHIKPAAIEAKNYTPAASCFALAYNEASLYLRKPAHSFGWDIFPRILTSGLPGKIYLADDKVNRIKDAFVFTREINYTTNNAIGCLYFDVEVSEDFITDYEIEIAGVCGDNSFYSKKRLWNTTSRMEFDIKDCKLWWPKGYGDANLYKVKISLYCGDKLCDRKELDYGVRLIELKTTEYIKDDGDSDFSFWINGRKIFVKGMNWVPTEAMYTNRDERNRMALELLDDSESNMVRCWGGGVYENDEFFDFCDKKGIMVWQDFSMACAVYPNDAEFTEKLKTEALNVIKRLRNHVSLVLWCGDNECDYAYLWKHWGGFVEDPNKNIITRQLLPEILRQHDFTRPYIPGSPYFSEFAYKNGKLPAERHMWGTREYFKRDEYKNNNACFISETGYHGCPSVKSVEKFISEEQLWPYMNKDGKVNDDWLVHCTSMETDINAVHAFRVHLMHKGVNILFDALPDNLVSFAKQSQISQAEAVKYFVERMRINREHKTGIILWNLLDGWPQFSDAIVDYYFVKKLAYHYIKRSQKDICLMFDEPVENKLTLFGVNDRFEKKTLTYKVENLYTGQMVLQGEARLDSEASTEIACLNIPENDKSFYFIEWEYDGVIGTNHYFTNVIDIDYDKYMSALEKCGYDQFDGM